MALRYLVPFLKMVWRTRPSYAFGIIAVRLVSAFTPLAMLWVAKVTLDTVLSNIGSPAPDWDGLIRLLVLELAIVLSSDVLGRISGLLEGLLGDLFNEEVSVLIMRHAAALDLEQLESPDVRDMMRRSRLEAGSIAPFSRTLSTGQQTITLLSLLSALLAFAPWLLLVLVVAVLPSFLGETVYTGIAHAFNSHWTKEQRELDYYRWVASEVAPAKELKLFGLSGYLIGKYRTLARDYLRESRRLATRRSATSGLFAMLSTIACYVATGVVVYQTVTGAVTVGTMTFIVGSFQQSRGLVGGILGSVSMSYRTSLNLRDFFAFLGTRPRIVSKGLGRPVPDAIREGIVLEAVGFRYPGRDAWAIRDVSFSIAPGERVAFVGENGAGKTTLVKLLTRLYEPTEGRILIDGIDLREYDVGSVRNAISVIFQDFVRYDLTARENIAAGQIDALSDEERIVAAAQKSCASEVIGRLDKGYDRILGRRFDGGADLSGGEWQTIALARAYVREAQVIVLDEPTAALDARAEYNVFRRFSELTQGKMAVLISHRFSTVRMADRMCVLEQGRLVETGSHEELIRVAGRYAELFNLQATAYR